MALNKEQAIAKARQDERKRAMEIVTEIFGNMPSGTIAHFNWWRAIDEIKGETDE
jgi:hypothetical protein